MLYREQETDRTNKKIAEGGSLTDVDGESVLFKIRSLRGIYC